MILHV